MPDFSDTPRSNNQPKAKDRPARSPSRRGAAGEDEKSGERTLGERIEEVRAGATTFTQVPTSWRLHIEDPKLRYFLAELLNLCAALAGKRSGLFRVRRSMLAESFGVSKKTIQRRLRGLEELGLLERIQKTITVNGQTLHNALHLRFNWEELGYITHPARVDPATGEVSRGEDPDRVDHTPMDNPDPTYTKSNSIAKKKEAYKEGATKTSAVGQFSADQEQIGGGGRTGVEDLSMDEDNPSEQEVHGSYLGSTADGDSSTSSAVGAAKSSPATAGPGEDDQLAGQAAEDFLRGVPGIGEPPEEGFPQPTDLFLDDRSHRLAEDKPCRPSAPPSTSKAAGARRRDELDELAALREHCAEQVQVLQRRKEALEKTHVRRLRQMIKSTDIHPWRESQLRKEGWGDEEIEEERLKLRQNAGRNAVSMSLLELIGLDDEPEAFRMGRVVYDSFGCEEEIAADFLRLLIAAHERQSLTKPLTYDLALAHARRRGKSGYGRMNNPRHADLYDDLAAELFKGD